MADDYIIDDRNFEIGKFKEDPDYHKSVKKILALDFPAIDYIHHNPAFNGTANIARQLCLYELYKMVLPLAGHIAEIGVWKGSSFLLWAKLVSLFEPHDTTLVHGFDWFKGVSPGDKDKEVKPGKCTGDYEKLRSLIDIQNIGNVARLHKLDVTKDLDSFFAKFTAARFKLVFIDAGIYEVVKISLPYFWERLNTGGLLVLDEFNSQSSPGETLAINELLPGARVQSFPWARQPTGYIVKE